jgi:hypothetical protein
MAPRAVSTQAVTANVRHGEVAPSSSTASVAGRPAAATAPRSTPCRVGPSAFETASAGSPAGGSTEARGACRAAATDVSTRATPTKRLPFCSRVTAVGATSGADTRRRAPAAPETAPAAPPRACLTGSASDTGWSARDCVAGGGAEPVAAGVIATGGWDGCAGACVAVAGVTVTGGVGSDEGEAVTSVVAVSPEGGGAGCCAGCDAGCDAGSGVGGGGVAPRAGKNESGST